MTPRHLEPLFCKSIVYSNRYLNILTILIPKLKPEILNKINLYLKPITKLTIFIYLN